MKRIIIIILVLSLTSFGFAADMEKEHPSDQPFKLAFDMGFRPFHYWTEKHEAAGFGIEVSEEIAKRLGRPGIEVVDVNWSGIFSGLFAKKYEAITFTLNITHERAKNMDYTEPFMTAGLSAAVRSEDIDKITSPTTLKDLKVGVNSGSVADGWVTDHEKEYGFEVSRFDKVADAVMALQTKKVDVVISQMATISTFTKEKPGLSPAFTIRRETDFGLGYAGYAVGFRKGDPYRYKVERVIEGMKIDGTLQKLMEPYFGKPDANNYVNIVFTGYGTPGIRAYEPEAYHTPILPEED